MHRPSSAYRKTTIGRRPLLKRDGVGMPDPTDRFPLSNWALILRTTDKKMYANAPCFQHLYIFRRNQLWPTQEDSRINRRTRAMNSPPSKSQDTGLEQSSPTESSSLLTEDAFCSERSQQLFEAIDELQSCGASRDIDLPEVCKCRTVPIKSLRLTRLACYRRRSVSWKVVAPAKLD